MKARRDKELRDSLRAQTAQEEAERARAPELQDEVPFVVHEGELLEGYSVVGQPGGTNP